MMATKTETLAERFWFARYRPKRDDAIVDVGAGRGEDLEVMCATGAWVIAIEAHPVQFMKLLEASEGHPRAICIQCACMDKVQEVGITDYKQWEDNAVVIGGSGVPAYPLDTLLQGIPTIDLLKVNIEGAERLALEGMTETLKHTRHAVICAHDFRWLRGEGERYRTHDLVVNRLQNAGFQTETTPDWWHVHGWRD